MVNSAAQLGLLVPGVEEKETDIQRKVVEEKARADDGADASRDGCERLFLVVG